MKFNDFMKKYWIVFFLVFAIGVSVFVRLEAYDYPITGVWAESTVENEIKGVIANNVMAEYPNLPQYSLVSTVNERFDTFLLDNRPAFDARVVEVGNYFDSRLRGNDGFVYAPDIDTYYWLRQADNILENGHVGDKIVDGEPWDSRMNAPFGVESSASFNPYFGVFIHKVLNLFGNFSLMFSMMWIPIIVGALAILPVFFLVKRFGNLFGAVFAALLIACLPYFVGRSSFGLFDTDVYNVTMPLFVVASFILFLDNLGKGFKSWFYLIVASFTVGLYSFIWMGWWFIFDILLGVCVIYMLFVWLVKKTRFKKVFQFSQNILAWFVISGIFVTLFTNFKTFLGIFTNPLVYLSLDRVVNVNSLFPNVFTTVAELNPASLPTIMAILGGSLLFCFVFIGLFSILFYDFFKKKFTLTFLFLLLLGFWFFVSLYMANSGVRFILLLVPCFILAFGLVVSYFVKLLVYGFGKIGLNKFWAFGVCALCFSLLLVVQVGASMDQAGNSVPLMNDAWWDSLSWVKENTSEDSIIVSWWDYGHWFKSVADRGVAFDGASQNSPLAYWVGKLLVTSSEVESVGILRMIACGNSRAFDSLDAEFNDTVRSVEVLDRIVSLGYTDALIVLKDEGVVDVGKVLDYSHCVPSAPALVYASSDMVSKAPVWTHFGLWSFSKAKMGFSAEGISPWLNYNEQSEVLENAVFTRMYFGKGEGLDTYKLVRNDTDFMGGDVLVYEVDFRET